MSLVQKYHIFMELHPDFGVCTTPPLELLFQHVSTLSYPMDVSTLEARVPIEFRGVELFFKIESSFIELFFEQLKDKVKNPLINFLWLSAQALKDMALC
jgi:hypothetical protein